MNNTKRKIITITKSIKDFFKKDKEEDIEMSKIYKRNDDVIRKNGFYLLLINNSLSLAQKENYKFVKFLIKLGVDPNENIVGELNAYDFLNSKPINKLKKRKIENILRKGSVE